jgi:hypothetical protein
MGLFIVSPSDERQVGGNPIPNEPVTLISNLSHGNASPKDVPRSQKTKPCHTAKGAPDGNPKIRSQFGEYGRESRR